MSLHVSPTVRWQEHNHVERRQYCKIIPVSRFSKDFVILKPKPFLFVVNLALNSTSLPSAESCRKIILHFYCLNFLLFALAKSKYSDSLALWHLDDNNILIKINDLKSVNKVKSQFKHKLSLSLPIYRLYWLSLTQPLTPCVLTPINVHQCICDVIFTQFNIRQRILQPNALYFLTLMSYHCKTYWVT